MKEKYLERKIYEKTKNRDDKIVREVRELWRAYFEISGVPFYLLDKIYPEIKEKNKND